MGHRGLRVPGEISLLGVNQAVAGGQDAQGDSIKKERARVGGRERERWRIVSEQIKNAWLCSGWRNNECPHSLPVTFGNSRDRVEEGNESKKRGYTLQFTVGSRT